MGSIAPQTDAADDPVPEPEVARPAILAAARRVAERDGMLDLSLLSVAQEAGVAPRSVYTCFNSRNDLLLSVIADDLGTLAQAMRGAFDSGADSNGDGSSGRGVSPTVALALLSSSGKASEDAVTVAGIAGDQMGTATRAATQDGNDKQNSAAQSPSSSGAAEAIAKLQETVARLETRPVDAWLERRLREFERALSALEGRQTDRNSAEKSVEERFRELSENLESLEQRLSSATDDKARLLAQRIDACENRLRGVASDTQAEASTLATRITALENAAFAARPEFFTAVPNLGQETEKAAQHMPPDPASEAATAEPIIAAGTAPISSYLAAARKSAQAAAVAQDTRVRTTPKHKSDTMVYVAMGSLFLFVAILTAAGLLLRNFAMNAGPAHARAHYPSIGHGAVAAASLVQKKSPRLALRALAEAGDPRAALLIGLDYLDGSGFAKNDAAAFAWLSRAAARNEPVAQYELGVMYENGRGVRSDPGQAFRWFESAALKGNRRAMHSLATAYAEGWGTEKNLFEAARWYGRGAELGSVNDQFNLGVLFERGMGVKQSLPDAYKWYAIAAAQGDRESQSRVAAIAPMLAPDDLAAAQSAAQSFKPDAPSIFANSPPALAQER
ncbi:MAG TPA: TetR family transcriptional regulator [Rhizomicrobium sp.]|nr:TetR family transcriptional regulator [Rhizomicrobium sp.]